MNPERWGKVERIFQRILDEPAARRASVLDECCAGDDSLRLEVESLLRHHELAGTFIETPAFAAAAVAKSARPLRNLQATRIAQYEVLEEIGGGGMGVVYKAEDTKLGRIVALKFLPEHSASDPDALDRFRREARAASALNHPNICTIYDIEEFEGEQFIAMEYIEGTTVADRIAAKPLDSQSIAEISIQIAEGLAAAHAKGIVHRDIKPANVIITGTGLVKVLDFGIAKLSRLEADSVSTQGFTQPGAMTGTAPYMSPEQLRGLNVDPRMDIYALGAVMYEMAAGTRPFPARALPDLIDQILNHTPSPLRTLNPAISPTLEHIVSTCLHKSPDDRYQHAKDVAAELRATLAPTLIESAAQTRLRIAIRVSVIALALLTVVALFITSRHQSGPSSGNAWVQLTDYPESVTSPAFSPDGRMLTFLRGPDTFLGPADLYVKLGSGEPTPLTTDGERKQDPIFSPDGSRISYTSGGPPFEIWSVPVTGGTPRLIMRNAASLTWTKDGRVLFSEMRAGGTMAVVSATENRSEPRDIYVPFEGGNMGRRAYQSPDGKWVLIAEMASLTVGWLPCRLTPFDGSSKGKQVGPASAACSSAAWSPDGKWMYFSSAAGARYHIWRQRFPDGTPEQVTSGPTEEEGVTVAPDGRSLITSVGGAQSTLWIQDDRGDRQIDTQAAVNEPQFSADGKKLFFVARTQLRGPDQNSGDLWVFDVASGASEPLLPGFQITTYDLSTDGKYVAFAATDEGGKSNVWVAALDRHSQPQRIPWDGPLTFVRFDPSGGFFVLATERDKHFAYHIDADGKNPRKVIEDSLNHLLQISPSGKWLMARVVLPSSDVPRIYVAAYPTSGGPPVIISKDVWFEGRWSCDGKSFLVPFESEGRPDLTVAVLPLNPSTGLPAIPAGGWDSPEQSLQVRGVRIVHPGISTSELAAFAAGPNQSSFAYARTVVHRNLYRVPLP